jgi:hypothetical protein
MIFVIVCALMVSSFTIGVLVGLVLVHDWEEDRGSGKG